VDREERLQRIGDIQRWIAEQHAEFADEAFPEEVRAAWDTNNAELDTLRAEHAELERRDQRVRTLAVQADNVERGGYDLGDRRTDGGRPVSPGPVVISRMSEDQVYDLGTVRFNPFSGDGGHQELRDRALRAVELARFPDVAIGRNSMLDNSMARGAVERLLNRQDDDLQGSLVARRILTTGHPAYRRAFAKTVNSLLRGVYGANLTVEEHRAMESVRAMAALTGSAGGFAVPYTLDPTIIPTSNLSVNPYRAICRVEQITVNEWRGVTSSGVTAAYASEAGASSDNSPTLAQPNAIVQRAQCFVPVSIELTQDWGGLQTELANLIQDAKDDLEAVQFSTGTGTPPVPTGLITGATSTVTAAGVASFAVGDLYTLEQTVPPRFRPRAQIVANRFTYNKVRQFDTAGGANLWTPLPAPLQQGLANQVPRGGNTGYELIGYGANECSGLASVLTTGSKIAVMGDPRYFIIVDRIGLDIEVIPHLFGAAQGNLPTGQRGFYAYWRNTARVLDPNAFRVLVTG
jgi:HK97 family phage major capsid protein